MALTALSLMLFNCHNETLPEVKTPQEAIHQSGKDDERDSLEVVFDSLMKLKVEVPLVIDKTVIDSTCSRQFVRLAQKTGGSVKVLVNTRFISKEIKKIIEANSCDSADVLFLIDKTGSMEDDIGNIKRGLNNVIESLKKFSGNRLCIACYGDRNADGEDWLTYRNFGDNYASARNFINSIEVTGGGDFPESVNDAFFQVLKKDFWRSQTKRLIILVGDAPSLLPPLSKYTIEDVIKKAREEKISMNFYPILISPYEKEDLGLARRMEETKMIQAIYPNPSNGLLNIDFVKHGSYVVDFLTKEGHLLSSEKVRGINYSKEFGELPDGLYLIRVTDSYKNYDNGRLIIRK